MPAQRGGARVRSLGPPRVNGAGRMDGKRTGRFAGYAVGPALKIRPRGAYTRPHKSRPSHKLRYGSIKVKIMYEICLLIILSAGGARLPLSRSRALGPLFPPPFTLLSARRRYTSRSDLCLFTNIQIFARNKPSQILRCTRCFCKLHFNSISSALVYTLSRVLLQVPSIFSTSNWLIKTSIMYNGAKSTYSFQLYFTVRKYKAVNIAIRHTVLLSRVTRAVIRGTYLAIRR